MTVTCWKKADVPGKLREGSRVVSTKCVSTHGDRAHAPHPYLLHTLGTHSQTRHTRWVDRAQGEQGHTKITETADTKTWTAQPELWNPPHREAHTECHPEPWNREEVEGGGDKKLGSLCKLGYMCLRILVWVFRDIFALACWTHVAADTGQGAETMRRL